MIKFIGSKKNTPSSLKKAIIYMLIGVVTVHLLQEMEEILDLRLSMVFLVLVVKLVTVGTEELLLQMV